MPSISVAYLVIGTTSKAYAHARRSHNSRLPHEKAATAQLAMFVCVERLYSITCFFLGKMLGTRYGPVGTRFL